MRGRTVDRRRGARRFPRRARRLQRRPLPGGARAVPEARGARRLLLAVQPRSHGAQGAGRAERFRQRGIFRRSEEHTSELQSQSNLVCRLLLEKKKKKKMNKKTLIIKEK